MPVPKENRYQPNPTGEADPRENIQKSPPTIVAMSEKVSNKNGKRRALDAVGVFAFSVGLELGLGCIKILLLLSFFRNDLSVHIQCCLDSRGLTVGIKKRYLERSI